MEQLANICKEGLPNFGIDKILLPVVVHRTGTKPAAFMKHFLKEKQSMYTRSTNDVNFLEVCKKF